jgi:hypothetical protein
MSLLEKLVLEELNKSQMSVVCGGAGWNTATDAVDTITNGWNSATDSVGN